MKNNEKRARAGALYGSLELMVLRVLDSEGPLHGLDVARRIEAISNEHLNVEEGALYPALHRLQREGWIEGEWRISDKRRRARFYDVTPAGRRHLKSELKQWAANTRAIGRVLGLEKHAR